MVSEQEQIKKLIERSRSVVITARENCGYDEVATALAWRHWLAEQGKQCEIIIDHQSIEQFRWLPDSQLIQTGSSSHHHFVVRIDTSKVELKELRYEKGEGYLDVLIGTKSGNLSPENVQPLTPNFPFDMIVSIGAVDKASLGRVYLDNKDAFERLPIINIDRRVDNTNFGLVNAVAITATSLGEISYELFDRTLDRQLAHYLLTGMIAATDSFQSPLVTPQTLSLASEFIVAGAKREEIVLNLYRNKDLATLKLWGTILSRLKRQEGVVYSFITRQEIGGADPAWWSLCQDLILTSPQAHIAILFYQKEFEETEVHVVARENFDLTVLLSQFKPDGSRRQVQFIEKVALPDIETRVLLVLAEKMKAIQA